MRIDRGLYVHIPFCLKKCDYCDFCSFPLSNIKSRNEYIESLCDEIRSYKEQKISVNTIFFGGGTPSLLTNGEFLRIFQSITSSFLLSEDTEFTIECNPKTLTKEKLYCYLKCGVNRLSIGLQSIHEKELSLLGRIHNFEDFLESYHLAREVGFKNINLDLMYGIPSQTIESFQDTLKKVVSLSPEHISVYGLIVEEGTPLAKKMSSLDMPEEESECDMYYFASEYLGENGYIHYEISNYSKNGFESRHNLKYWRCQEYIGVGLSAHSYFKDFRSENTSDFETYISNYNKKIKAEFIDCENKAFEYVMLGLRLKEGISLFDFENKFGYSFLKNRENIIEKLISENLVVKSGDTLSLTERGFYLSNWILSELL